MAVIKSMGGALVLEAEHLLTTSTRAPGGDLLDVVFDSHADGTIRLSLAPPAAETPAEHSPGEHTPLRFKDCGHLTAETCDDDCDEINTATAMSR
ncbi:MULTISPECIES: hypothetical protein [Streptomyces]|uniref:Uncharacterized protein n=1 Tax=Streptomyces dengpaensis TaxID=2049881 RepID=A0ABM6T3N0_9ACTN|nr:MULTISPECIES: hypothetical protein [Streptomyces]AVH61713.1 hypothetical protein C4B68_40070 [Streptomyces dengpaensis]PIB05080.1 hypothetical protein B1C81_30715 [Streptomyces sp. HG99]